MTYTIDELTELKKLCFNKVVTDCYFSEFASKGIMVPCFYIGDPRADQYKNEQNNQVTNMVLGFVASGLKAEDIREKYYDLEKQAHEISEIDIWK